MFISNITLRTRNYCVLKKISNAQSFNIISSEQLRNCYPLLLNINKSNYYSRSGLVLPRNNFENYKLQKLFSSQIDVRSKNPEDIKELSSSSNSGKDNERNKNAPALTRKEKFKKIIKEYGSIVIVFHIGISLISLGICYLFVSSGLNVEKFIEAVGLDRWITKTEMAASAGTFAVAYAIHKVFAPVRITITIGSIPFIVRYLRRIGFLRK